MGSSGQKRRKSKTPQHLSKVGSTAGSDRHLRSERKAVLDNMGVRGAPAWVRAVAIIVVFLLIVAAIGSLHAVTIFR